MNLNNPIIAWVGAILLVLIYFYGMNHFVMGAQGLPVDVMLRPVQ